MHSGNWTIPSLWWCGENSHYALWKGKGMKRDNFFRSKVLLEQRRNGLRGTNNAGKARIGHTKSNRSSFPSCGFATCGTHVTVCMWSGGTHGAGETFSVHSFLYDAKSLCNCHLHRGWWQQDPNKFILHNHADKSSIYSISNLGTLVQ